MLKIEESGNKKKINQQCDIFCLVHKEKLVVAKVASEIFKSL